MTTQTEYRVLYSGAIIGRFPTKRQALADIETGVAAGNPREAYSVVEASIPADRKPAGITAEQARIAAECLVDVYTPNGDAGVITDYRAAGDGAAHVECSTLDGVDRESGWFPLPELSLPAESRRVVARYLP